jgi:hypothetical protein
LLPFNKLFSFVRNHNSTLCDDHDNKINVWLQLVAPSILSEFSGNKAKQSV